jgi:hypothetical protein
VRTGVYTSIYYGAKWETHAFLCLDGPPRATSRRVQSRGTPTLGILVPIHVGNRRKPLISSSGKPCSRSPPVSSGKLSSRSPHVSSGRPSSSRSARAVHTLSLARQRHTSRDFHHHAIPGTEQRLEEGRSPSGSSVGSLPPFCASSQG